MLPSHTHHRYVYKSNLVVLVVLAGVIDYSVWYSYQPLSALVISHTGAVPQAPWAIILRVGKVCFISTIKHSSPLSVFYLKVHFP